MDLFDIFDVFGDMTGCCFISLAILLLLLTCAACIIGLSLTNAF